MASSSPNLNHWLADDQRRCLLMGIVNITPDSFSDGGQFLDPARAIDQALRLIDEGADLIDLGGQTTRPGAAPVPDEQQLQRIMPVLTAIRPRTRVPISIDTTSAVIARQTLDAGADLINDISAGRFDPDLLPLLASRQVPVVLMHMQGTPQTMQANPHYEDVVAQVRQFLIQRRQVALDAGIDRAKIILDVGIGFGKTLQHNLSLLRHLDQLTSLGQPLLMGVSRKAFIGAITHEPDPARRLMGTAAACAWSITRGASILRVHDVQPIAQVRAVLEAIAPPPTPR